MFCGQCGKNLPDDVRFCQSCGRPTSPAAIPASFTNATAAAVPPALSSFPAPGTASHQQLVKHYAEMSDEEFMNVAGDVASLEDHARIIIAGELSRRKLSKTDITQYRERVASFKPKDFWGQDKHIARSVNGCGTSICGERDFESDGSFVTTKWVVVFFVPVWPLASMRVKVVKNGWFKYDSYLVRQSGRPCWKQVACVYSYLLLLLFTAAILDFLPSAATLVMVGALCVLPWCLRRLARARAPQPLP